MRPARLVRFAAVGAACGLVVVSGLAATNTVAASRAERDVSSITADQKKPKPDCNGITVTAIEGDRIDAQVTRGDKTSRYIGTRAQGDGGG